MAIKISGTTVIDDSRNLCNIANVNASNLNADVGGAYVCRMACNAINEGELVMYPSDAVCAAEACLPAIAPSILSDTNINACFTHTHAVSRFCGSCNCFVSLYLRALSKTDIYCDVGVFVCLAAHCVGTDGSISCTCILECCVCNVNCCCGWQMCGFPIGLESCNGYKTFIKVPYMSNGSSTAQEWTYNVCLNSSTCQVCLISVNVGGFDCRIRSFGWVTPDRCYYINYWNCSREGCSNIFSDPVGVRVVKLCDDVMNTTLPNTVGYKSTLSCGLPLRCTQLKFDCYQWPANTPNSNQVNVTLGVAPYTYGCDGWTIIQDVVQAVCNCCNDTRGKGKMFAIKPLGDNCFRTTCCFYEWPSSLCQELDGCYCCASTLMCCMPNYKPGSCNVTYSGAVDTGDGIKRFMWSYIGTYGSLAKYMACFCVSSSGYICDQGTFGASCSSCSNYLQVPRTIYDNQWQMTRGDGISQISADTLMSAAQDGGSICYAPCDCNEAYKLGQYMTRRLWSSMLRTQGRGGDSRYAQCRILGSVDSSLYRSSWPICPCTGTYFTAAGIQAQMGQIGYFANAWQSLYDTALCCVFNGVCGFSGSPGSTSMAYCYHLGNCGHWCCACSCTANCPHADCQCCAILSSNGCFMYQTGNIHSRFDIRCNNVFWGQSGCLCRHRQCWLGAGGIIPMQNCTVWIVAGSGGTEPNWIGPNEAGCVCYCTSIEVFTTSFDAPNHNRFLGIAQNTVSAGETVKIAVPGTVDRSSFTCNYIINCLGCHLTGSSAPVQLHMYGECRSPLACQVFGAYDGATNPFMCTYGGGAFFTFYPNYDCGSCNWISYIGIPGAGTCISKF